MLFRSLFDGAAVQQCPEKSVNQSNFLFHGGDSGVVRRWSFIKNPNCARLKRTPAEAGVTAAEAYQLGKALFAFVRPSCRSGEPLERGSRRVARTGCGITGYMYGGIRGQGTTMQDACGRSRMRLVNKISGVQTYT